VSARSGQRLFTLLVALVAVSCVAVLVRLQRGRARGQASSDTGGLVSQEAIDRFIALENREKEANQTVWAKEILAQECGRVFENLWDALNRATNKFALLESWPVGEIIPPRLGPARMAAHDIALRESSGGAAPWKADGWRRFLADADTDGWRLERVEFRHNQFETDSAGLPRHSQFYFSAHLTRQAPDVRALLEGDLVVDWAAKRR